jgi:hypothetical protein
MLRSDRFVPAPWWVNEYDSAVDSRQSECLTAYSPYHHAVAGASRPATLFTTDDLETRVNPLHARTGGQPLSERIAEEADFRAFLHRMVGKRWRSTGVPPTLCDLIPEVVAAGARGEARKTVANCLRRGSVR